MKKFLVFAIVFAAVFTACTDSRAESDQSTALVAVLPDKASALDVVDDAPSNELEVRAYRGGEPSIKLYLEKSFSDKIAVSITAFKTRGWDEATVGPVYYVTPEMSVGISIGASYYASSDEYSKSSHLTYSTFWYWKTDAVESTVTFEYYARDPKPWYYSAYLQTPITKNFSAGVFAEKTIGFGPRFTWSVNKSVSLWVVPIVKKDGDSDVSLIAGAQFLF